MTCELGLAREECGTQQGEPQDVGATDRMTVDKEEKQICGKHRQ